jgi:AraC family transcriptional activator FtrA
MATTPPRSSGTRARQVRLGGRGPSIAVYAFDGMSPFELGCVVEVFGMPRPEFDFPWYELSVCAESAGPLRAVGGFTLATPHGLDVFAAARTVVVPAVGDVRGPVSPALIKALRTAHDDGARVVSICSGAFALAAAGLLDGREATTHWRYARLLAERYPRVRVNPDVLYVDEGQVLTSAGSAAGLDLCLHLVRGDHGSAVANAVARRLVLPAHRDGGQAQFIESPVPTGRTRRKSRGIATGDGAAGGTAGGTDELAGHDDAGRDSGDDSGDDSADGLARSLDWALEHLGRPLRVADLAAAAHMSQRTYIRRFAQATGTSPLRWLLAQRIAAGRELLETTDAPVERVGETVGFGDPASFRHHFRRAVGTAPSAYRASWNATGAAARLPAHPNSGRAAITARPGVRGSERDERTA